MVTPKKLDRNRNGWSQNPTKRDWRRTQICVVGIKRYEENTKFDEKGRLKKKNMRKAESRGKKRGGW